MSNSKGQVPKVRPKKVVRGEIPKVRFQKRNPKSAIPKVVPKVRFQGLVRIQNGSINAVLKTTLQNEA